MKIRNGFVSNSSSSSFIISGNAYDDIFEVAIDMIGQREWERDAALIKKIKMAKESGEYSLNAPLAFDSCNYNTFIIQEHDVASGGEVYHITTCYNHPFELNGIVGGGGGEDDGDDICEKYYFWWPEYDILARAPTYEEIDDAKISEENYHFCKKHYRDLLMLRNKKIICPQCEQEKKK